MGRKNSNRGIGGRVPDIIYDYGAHGKEPITKIFGKTATEVAKKIVEIGKLIAKT